MKLRILLTTASFQDTPGRHHDYLEAQGYQIDRLRGPIKEDQLLEIIDRYDGIICGDDDYTRKVLQKGKAGRLKVISKYGIGLDRIDLKAAKELGILVSKTPGVNQVSVAEHTLGLLFSFFRNIHIEHQITQKGGWKRMTGHELSGKSLGIVGLGMVGKALATRAQALGLKVSVFDKFPDKVFAEEHGLMLCNSIEELTNAKDIISLNIPLTEETKSIISSEIIENKVKKGVVFVNTARALLLDQNALITGLQNGSVGGYLTDVMEEEPMDNKHPLLQFDNVIITPHIGSRTFQSVQRQGSAAVKNLIDNLNNY